MKKLEKKISKLIKTHKILVKTKKKKKNYIRSNNTHNEVIY